MLTVGISFVMVFPTLGMRDSEPGRLNIARKGNRKIILNFDQRLLVTSS